MLALCPHCLQQSDLAVIEDPDQGRVLRCGNPTCDYPTIPLLYGEDYHAHPPAPVSIIGLSGHGKTVFIESLIHEVQQLGARWANSGFYFTWLDEVQMRNAYKRIRSLREGQLPKGTRTVFQQPQVLRLSNIPRVGGCQLVIFDTGGEAFLDTATLSDAGKYVRNSSAVIWLLSLKRGDPYDSPDDVNQMMAVYLQTMARMGGRTREQNLILVLTKGDELLARPDLPESARQALAAGDYSPAGPIWGTLDTASTELEAWLRSDRCGYHNLVNLVKSRFKSVRYCIVSAQGAPASGDSLQYGMMPRGVMAPLLWLWRLDRDPIWVERDGKRAMFLNMADALTAAAGGVLRLEERVYHVPTALNIMRPVTVVGRGAGKTVLEVSAPGYGIGVATPGKVLFRDLTVRRAAPTPGDVIRVMAGELELANVTVTGGLSGTADDKPVKGQGVLVARQGQLGAASCTFRGNHGNGVLVFDQAQAQFAECVFEGNGDAGLFVRTAGALAIAKSTSMGNQTGIRIEAAAAATLEGNGCDQNAGCGIVLTGSVGPAVVVRGNRCSANSRDGIQLREQAAATVSGNVCTANKRNGLSFTDQSAGTASGNTCSQNGRNGVRVCDDAAPQLEDTSAEGNAECGVLYEGRASGVARRTTVRDNHGDGIRLEGDSSPRLEEIDARFNEGYGVAIAEPKSVVEFDARQSVLEGNKKGPVLETRPKKASWWGY
jgi:parallel beta-helix repeat protein